MKKKIAIAILVIASYVGIALFVNSVITENEEKLVEQTEKFEKQEKDFEKLEEKAKDYLKYSMTDDCIYYGGEEIRSFCQCSMNYAVENNNAIDLINMDMGFDDERLDEEIDEAFEKCGYLAI